MFLKRFARDAFYWSADATGRLRSRESAMSEALTVLTYHRVLPDAEARACPFPSLAMPESWFRAQMVWLSRNARVLPLGAALEEEKSEGPPRVAVTFDDGYFDNFDCALPVLRACNLKATFFICTGPVRDASRFWYDSVAEGFLRWGSDGLKRHLVSASATLADPLAPASNAHAVVDSLKRTPDPVRRAAVAEVERQLGAEPWKYRSHVMTADQVRTLASEGHEIGSHTETHPLLPQLAEAEAAAELRNSKAWLERLLGQRVPGFCYPNGTHTAATREWVAGAGYAYACLTEEGQNRAGFDPYRIRRVDMAPNRVGDCFDRWSERSFRAVLSLLRRPAAVGRS